MPRIGILGLGYLGSLLARDYAFEVSSWGTWHKNPPQDINIPVFPFDWGKKKSWPTLPKTEVILLITIPPILKSTQNEAKRLRLWCDWMQKNRPEIKRLIYISTTGVYPKRNGLWLENSEFESDTNSGKLRLLTEKILSEYFYLNVVRPGGIYGPGRGINIRLKHGKPIPVSSTPVHRIHVKDLARIIVYLAKNPKSISCVNAVDFEAKPSHEVAQWLIENRKGFTQKMLSESSVLSSRENNSPKRYISNQCLIDLRINLIYPTFREGMEILENGT